MKMQRLGSALVPMMLAMACGGDGGGGDVNLGVDDNKVIEDLTAEEAIKICERLQDATLGGELSKEQNCTLGAVLLTSDATQCGMFRDQCVAAPDQAPEDGDDGDDDTDCSDDDPSEREGCKATVGEFEDCLDASAAKFDGLKDLTCDDAGEVSQEELSETPEACSVLTTKCPNLFAEDDQDGSGSGDGSLRKARRSVAH